MIIDRPLKAHIPALRRLWKQAFGDRDDFLDGFFQTGFSYDRCRCLHTDGVLASALYWFDCSWKGKKVAYLYAVATDAAFQGKGLCRALMEDTHKHLQSLGYAGAALVPGDGGLSAMYGKFGYQGFCPVKKVTASAEEAMAATRISPEAYHALRQTLLGNNSILQEMPALYFLATYGGFYKTEKAVFCGYRQGDSFCFEEALGEISPRQEACLQAMYLPFDNDPTLPAYLGIPLN